jgi:hypothetical protein
MGIGFVQAIYGIETKALNRAVKRNLERFPVDFMFQLTDEEAKVLRFQFGTLEKDGPPGRMSSVERDECGKAPRDRCRVRAAT